MVADVGTVMAGGAGAVGHRLVDGEGGGERALVRLLVLAGLVAPGAIDARVLAQQRELGIVGGVVMEGRDIGTKVFPDADLKIFLDADPVIREQRRLDQQQIKGPSAQDMAAELRERDLRDRTRVISPLVPANDAVILDSTSLSEDEVLRRAEALVRQRMESN